MAGKRRRIILQGVERTVHLLSFLYDTDRIENEIMEEYTDRVMDTNGRKWIHRQQGDIISLFLFYKNKESRQKINIQTYGLTPWVPL
jgi:hypothetical protein